MSRKPGEARVCEIAGQWFALPNGPTSSVGPFSTEAQAWNWLEGSEPTPQPVVGERESVLGIAEVIRSVSARLGDASTDLKTLQIASKQLLALLRSSEPARLDEALEKISTGVGAARTFVRRGDARADQALCDVIGEISELRHHLGESGGA